MSVFFTKYYIAQIIPFTFILSASRMDDYYEMSVTSTDCQFPNCRFVASVYTYPYCHEHKTLSPYYTASAGNKQQVVNDLNKERTTKSSSMTEKSSATGRVVMCFLSVFDILLHHPLNSFHHTMVLQRYFVCAFQRCDVTSL